MSTIDYNALRFWMDIAHWVALIALAVWGYLRTRDKDNAQAIKLVSTELATFIQAVTRDHQDTNSRVTVLEVLVKNLPTDQEVSHIGSDVASVRATLKGQGQLLESIGRQVTLIQTHLLSGNQR